MPPEHLNGRISHVIFDFDGTLSWLRHGWPAIMLNIFRPHLPRLPEESDEQLEELLLADILALNGKQTIYQMVRLAERVRERGGRPPDAQELFDQFQAQLDEAIAHRTQRIASGAAAPDEYLVHGARPFLEKLIERGLDLVILSGTIEHRVKEEAEILGLSQYFGRHIYGSHLDLTQFSKQMVIARILREAGIEGRQLLSFGDGRIEIECTKEVGGSAVGVASDESENGSGRADPAKAHVLRAAGADAVIADFRDPEMLIARFFER